MLNINELDNPIQQLPEELFTNIFCCVKELNFIYENKDKLTIKKCYNNLQYPSGCVVVYFQKHGTIDDNKNIWFIMGHETFDGIDNYDAISSYIKRLNSRAPSIPSYQLQE